MSNHAQSSKYTHKSRYLPSASCYTKRDRPFEFRQGYRLNPATADVGGSYTDEQRQFMLTLNQYKRELGKPQLSPLDILRVAVCELGYTKDDLDNTTFAKEGKKLEEAISEFSSNPKHRFPRCCEVLDLLTALGWYRPDLIPSPVYVDSPNKD